MITVIGAKPKRVIHNITWLKPEILVIIKQKKEGWSEKNREYKKYVLDRFYRNKLIKSFDRAKRLRYEYIDDLTDDEKFFHQLLLILKKYANYRVLDLDTTAMPRRASIIATVVASMFPNVRCWAAGKKGYGRYSLKNYPKPNEEGSDPVMIPLLRRDISKLEDPTSRTRQVFEIIYNEYLTGKKKGDERILIKQSNVQNALKDLVDPRGISIALDWLEKEGWIIDEGMNNYSLHPFATCLGSLLFKKEERIEYEDVALVKELIAQNEDAIQRLVQQFRTYSNMNEERIKNWLLQFPTRSSARVALKLLGRVEYIDMQKVRDYIKEFYEALPSHERESAVFAILGRLSDSSGLVSYFLAHEAKNLKVYRLEDALSRDSAAKMIIFVEDCLISSTQAKQIFAEWLGKATSYKYVSKLSNDQIIRLKQLEMKIHFIVATEDGKKELSEFLQKLGCKITITANRLLRRDSDSCFEWSSSHNVVFENKEEMERAKKEFYLLNKKLLQTRAEKEGWSAEQLEKTLWDTITGNFSWSFNITLQQLRFQFYGSMDGLMEKSGYRSSLDGPKNIKLSFNIS
jgi:hypothetical protein